MTEVRRRGPRGRPSDVQVGQQYDRWTVTGAFARREPSNNAYFPCRCICGTEREVVYRTLREIQAGKITGSCGCRQIESNRKRLTTHGRSRDKRFAWLWRNYGITPEDFDRLREEQGDRCKICLNVLEYKGFRVDHDHKTGAVRGLLCHGCNVGIGHLKEDVEVLKRAIAYLEGSN